jgi:hypothetical protein
MEAHFRCIIKIKQNDGQIVGMGNILVYSGQLIL